MHPPTSKLMATSVLQPTPLLVPTSKLPPTFELPPALPITLEAWRGSLPQSPAVLKWVTSPKPWRLGGGYFTKTLEAWRERWKGGEHFLKTLEAWIGLTSPAWKGPFQQHFEGWVGVISPKPWMLGRVLSQILGGVDGNTSPQSCTLGGGHFPNTLEAWMC